MIDFQDILARRFDYLRETRDGPIFFIEHGLSEDDLTDMTKLVRQYLELHTIQSNWWKDKYLPLLVCATEVGYQYYGSGTDFWPVLEEALATSISFQDRQCLRDAFEHEANNFGGAQPTDTPWSTSFHLIAWPIHHALVPMEFHRQLSQVLTRLYTSTGSLSDDDLHGEILTVTPRDCSTRFRYLVSNKNLIVSIARSLLNCTESTLSEYISKRISKDIESDETARRAITLARKFQREGLQVDRRSDKTSSDFNPFLGTLQVRKSGDTYRLMGVFSDIPGDARQRMRSLCRRHRILERLWGSTTPILLENLVNGTPFYLKLTSIPEPDAELLPDLDDRRIEPSQIKEFSHLTLKISTPLLFVLSPDGELGRHIVGNKINGKLKYLLAIDSQKTSTRLDMLGNIDILKYTVLNPQTDAHRIQLGNLGYEIDFNISMSFYGDPPLSQNSVVPTFFDGDKKAIFSNDIEGREVRLHWDDQCTTLQSSEFAYATLEKGSHKLRVESEGNSRDYPLAVLSSERSRFYPVCKISCTSSEYSIQSFLAGSLIFDIDCSIELQGITLYFEIEVEKKRISISKRLNSIPSRITISTEPLSILLGDSDVYELLSAAPFATVKLSLGKICSYSLDLEKRIRPCWWEKSGDNNILMTELGRSRYGWISSACPADPPSTNVSDDSNVAHLLTPIDLDVLTYGEEAKYSTLCIAPTSTQLRMHSIHPPKIGRRRVGTKEELGAEEIVTAYLRWSLAETRTVIDEYRRMEVVRCIESWMSRAYCGIEWADRERELLSSMNPWDLLFQEFRARDFCRDGYISMTQEESDAVTRISIDKIQISFPNMWNQLSLGFELADEDFERLDRACADAYTDLSKSYEQSDPNTADRLSVADPGATADQWNQILGIVLSKINMLPLAELLHPTDLVPSLISMQPTWLTLDDLADELTSWARRADQSLFGSAPGSDDMRAMLGLWLQPEIVPSLDWNWFLDTLVSERSIVRVTRYVSLRFRSMKGTENLQDAK